MFTLQTTVFIPLITAFVATILATPISLFFIKKLGIVDDPKKHKHPAIIHKKPIPRAGGIPLFVGVLVASLVFFLGHLRSLFFLVPHILEALNICTSIVLNTE